MQESRLLSEKDLFSSRFVSEYASYVIEFCFY
jgi:hypothetical protein